MSNKLITIAPDCTLELLVADHGDFLGIGAVTVCGVPLRCASRPIQIRLDTPDGILYPRLEFVRMDPEAGGAVRVRLRAHGNILRRPCQRKNAPCWKNIFRGIST